MKIPRGVFDDKIFDYLIVISTNSFYLLKYHLDLKNNSGLPMKQLMIEIKMKTIRGIEKVGDDSYRFNIQNDIYSPVQSYIMMPPINLYHSRFFVKINEGKSMEEFVEKIRQYSLKQSV
jgi:hypothetical protein